ncbi:hypothetical protein ABPG73_012347 [Tetrahymena malaccensis]
MNCSSAADENITFSIKPFNQTGLFTSIQLQINGQFEFNNKDFNYQTQSILDYSNVSSQVLDAFKTFTDTLSSEIINGECKKEQNSSDYICIIQLRHNSNPLSFSNLSFDYISKYNNRENKQTIVKKLFEHYKDFEDGLFQNSYFEKIRNKCFQQLSSNILVFLPVSQVNDQRIVDQLIQNNIQNRIKIIHYFQGAKTMKEFEEIFYTTLSYKYPLLNNQNDDMCYTDLRSQYVDHCFIGDIQNQEFVSNNQPILKQLQEVYIFGERYDLVGSLTSCLNQEIPNYFQIISKNNQTSQDQIHEQYNFKENNIIFNSQEYEMKSIKQQISKYKYNIFKQIKEQKKFVYKILLYLGGDLDIINSQLLIQKDIRNKIFRIQYKQKTIQYQQTQSQICNDYVSLIKYSLENQIIDINLGQDIQLDKSNKTISYEKKQQGIYLFTINLIQKQN